MPAGRPTKYKDEYVQQAYKFCLLGATNEEMAKLFDVSLSTFNLWITEYEEFSDALKSGKEKADAEIAQSLYHRAKGYSHPDIHITQFQGDVIITPITKHYPPDTGAAMAWLKNRQSKKWRDRYDHEVSGSLVLIKGEDSLED